MNRRIFLKLLGLSPIAPSVLMAKEKDSPEKGEGEKGCEEWECYLTNNASRDGVTEITLYHNGEIMDKKIWNRILSRAEFDQIHNSPFCIYKIS